MVFRSFRFQVIFRLILLILSALLLVYLIDRAQHLITSSLTGLFIILQIISFIRYVESTNTKLTRFLESIRHSDFSSSFSDPGMGKSFEKLNRAFNDVINDFKETRAEKEEHFNYLQTVVQHISIGIIVFTKDGKVDIANNAVKKLLKKRSIHYIDDLKGVKSELPELLIKIKSGDKHLIKLFLDDELLQLSIYATEFRMRGDEYTLVSIQNISSELEEKEIESWQRLIRVLTHEIMNSITPISSLATTVNEMMIDADSDPPVLKYLDPEDIESVQSALYTIQSRSQGLLNFVEIYRNLTRIPKPNFRYFPVKDLFDRCQQLLKPKIDNLNISFGCSIFPQNLMLTADPDLIDQVMINLMLNAIDAIKDKKDPQIMVSAGTNVNGRIYIEISDNGYGIKPDIIDKIFMPFFTSKKGGSGIGLSLSRQIMHLHKGTISVKSKPDEGTTFSLTF